ncbi:hypothetical protein PCC7418_0990 [Halothece sp. PCC 7418]|uniref:hypothetical protein n=1 Tax=Halothece sp. (strain PCC 7418) TaxID=65093 RepID=UPI0002A0778D|nr:hypothetical protein [Halothece sp. PCC 7418]AFZ43198.1 hypothetical protein PCC7418_0990 [Halothece sp. PCC 7418]
MKKLLLIHLFLILGLPLSSCQLLPFGTETEPTNDEANSPSNGEEPTSEQAETEQEQETPVTEEATSPTRGVAGLTPATDPDEFIQARGVTPGEERSDPFSLFPVPPDGEIQLQTSDTSSPDSLPNLPNQETPPPPPPEPELARAVQVQGAIQVGDQVSVILKAPNEETSRYVRAGQLIADNQVLVKRININQQPNPTVVLEELGIEQEVIKSVEEGVTVGARTSQEQSAAQLPPPPPPSI